LDLLPLDWEESDRAKADIAATIEALEKLSLDAARRFVLAYEEALNGLCRTIPVQAAERRRLPPDEQASLALSRPTHRARFQTSPKRSRFSARVVWYVFYWLYDVNRDGLPETLYVVTVRSASASALWQEAEQADENDSIAE
jgi:hypothetical protein